MPSNLAIETLHKLIRGDTLPRRGYELGEQLTSLDPIKVAELLQGAVPGMAVNVERVTTTGFKDALKLYGVQYRASDQKFLVLPKTHAEIIGVHCALPERPPADSKKIADEDRQSSAAYGLSDLDVDRIFQGEVSRSRVEIWLAQFQPADQWAIIRALDSFEYIGQQKSLELCRVLHDKVAAAAHGSPIRYVPFGRPGRSGGLIAYEFSKANSYLGEFVDPNDISALPLGTVIVFLDDIVATGHQAAQELSQLTSHISNHRVLFGVLAATVQGSRYVEEHSNVEVIAAMMLAPDGNPLLSGADAEIIRATFDKYGANLVPRAPLGYAEGCHLIAFHHAAPDNSPPVFWASRPDWTPLLHRGGSQRTGYIANKI